MARYSVMEASAAPLTKQAAEVAKFEEQIRPCDPDEGFQSCALLFTLPSRDTSGNDPETADAALEAAYRIAIEGEPLWAVKEAVMAFVRGRIGSGFRPNSAELGKEIESRTAHARRQLQRAREADRDARQALESRPVAPYVPPSLEPPRGFKELNLDGQTSFTHDEVKRLHDTKRLPVGASWKARTGQIFMPIGSELKPGISEAEAKAEDFNLYPDRDEWERIHAPKVTPEEWAMREAAE